MSLKHFHVVFIIAAILISFGFSAWAFWGAMGAVKADVAEAAWVTLALGAGLVAYAGYWLRKSRTLSTT
jgi:hypothetical protein